MLPPADEAIVARDSELPGLRLALDPQALGAMQTLPPMRSLHLRYKPGTNCVASLAPAASDGLAAVAVMAYPPARYAEVRARRKWHAAPNPVIFHDKYCLAIVPLALDRKLKGAQRIADPQRGKAFLHSLTGNESAATNLRLLRYKARRRLVISAGDPAQRAQVKAYTKVDFPAALEGARIAAQLNGAPILGVSERRRCIAWRWLEGTTLDAGAGEIAALADWRAAGQALAHVHQASLRPQTTLDRSDEAAELAAIASDLVPLAPHLARMAAPVIQQLAERLAQTAFTETLIHGDFSADQILIHDGCATIIDWDRAATGDPARDVGSFLARLDAHKIDGRITTDHFGSAFLAGYTDAGGPARAEASTVQHARALLALISEGFRQRRPNWQQRACQVITRAAEVLACRQPGPGSAPVDPAMPALSAALDATTMAPALAKALSQTLQRTEPELVRHKPGRRALIRYRIEGAGNGGALILLGKMRAKGPDLRTPRLHAALRAHGLDGRAPARVGVPAPRGCVATPALWLQEAVPGRSLDAFLFPGANQRPAAQAGAALAHLHATAVAARRQWSLDDEMQVLERALEHAGRCLPQRTAELAAIAEGAAQSARSLAPAAVTGIHRDFYHDQVLIDGDTTWLLDFDCYAEGDPAIDVANFLAHLDELGLRRHGSPAALAAYGTAFMQGYDAVRTGMDPARVHCLRLIALARHIHLSQIIPGRSHITSQLIDYCTMSYAASAEEHDQAAARP